jgi:hypothetical protein
MRAIIFSLFLLMGCGSEDTADYKNAASSPALSREAQGLIAPVLGAIDAEKARQAALPRPADDRERLVRMGQLDQAGRRLEGQLDLSTLPESERMVAYAALMNEIEAVDRANQAALLEMVPPEGWFHQSRYGEAASEAAFLIVQHGSLDLWQRFVPVLEPLVASGEIDGLQYALMYDRLALREGRPQRYGSQMICVEGRYVTGHLEDPDSVDVRRAAMEMGPLADYEALFARRPPCTS